MELLDKVHYYCLEIMKDIDRVCKKNNIHYSLCGGSVIGAMLYKGFIPWDDDIDIMMDRNNYEKFLKVYPIEGKKNYKVINMRTTAAYKVPALFTRIVDSNVEIVELLANQVEKKSNVFVDITVFDDIENKFFYRINEIRRHYVYS